MAKYFITECVYPANIIIFAGLKAKKAEKRYE